MRQNTTFLKKSDRTGITQQPQVCRKSGDITLKKGRSHFIKNLLAEDGTDGFELIYLGFKSNSFQTEEIAKDAAPKFAMSVLQKMISSVQTDQL